MVVFANSAKDQTEPDTLSTNSSPDTCYSYLDSPDQLTVSTIIDLAKDMGSPSINSIDSCFKYIEDCTDEYSVSTIPDLAKNMKIVSNVNGSQVESLSNNKLYVPEQEEKTSKSLPKPETWYGIVLQITIPFMIAGIGTIGAGLVLGTVEHYEVFKCVGALYVVIPSIIGLKGNLDTCLASRLSTQANLGNMNNKKELVKMVFGNIGVVQIQAVVAATIASIFAVCVSALGKSGPIDYADILLVASASILTATLSCFVLDFALTAVIYLTYRLNLNPDNLAAPLAASIGDIVSLTVLSVFARTLYNIHDTYSWVFYIILGFYIFIVIPCWVILVKNNEYTKGVLTHGWLPVITALLISGMGGLVLERAVANHSGFAVYQPMINGVGGNLVSIQSSRISTMLHQTSIIGEIPKHTKQWVAPWTALFKGVPSARSARILILISIPGQIIFVFVADVIYNKGSSSVTPAFLVAYLTVGLVQIMTLLYVSHLLCHTMWKFKIDPDNSTIPYLTALGDLGGSSLLWLAFIALKSFGQEYSDSS